ncbi:MAG: hypothetical protein LBU41_04520 [Clostridiales Family XIII bacterium]|jgi:hypothetical protein|nr:hypothetical protein [Clostridiales Family XIII bacterium]
MPLIFFGGLVLGVALLLITISNKMSKKTFGADKQQGTGAQRPSNVQYEKSEDGKIVYIFREKTEGDEVVDETVVDTDVGTEPEKSDSPDENSDL